MTDVGYQKSDVRKRKCEETDVRDRMSDVGYQMFDEGAKGRLVYIAAPRLYSPNKSAGETSEEPVFTEGNEGKEG